MTKCDKCHSRSIIHQRYSGMRLCTTHFQEDVRRKVREDLRKTGLFGRGACVAIGLDGGWGSAVLLQIMQDIFSRRRDINLMAITVVEGEVGTPHRDQAFDQARQLAKRLNVRHIVAPPDYAEIPGEASGCRDLADRKMNRLMDEAHAQGASILATGHSLDSVAGEVFLKFLQGDVDGLFRQQDPEARLHHIRPLQRIPAREMRLYARQCDLLPANSKGHDRSSRDDLRQQVRRQLGGFDSRHPGTNYSLLRSLERIHLLKGVNASGAKPLSDDRK